MTWLLFALMIFFLLIRIPVGAGMLLSCLIVILIDGYPPEVVSMQLFEGLFSFPIIAVPLFFLIGELCNFTSITERILDLARTMVGNVRGGLAHVSIIASMLFSGISGSNTADTVAVGTATIPRMLQANYPKSVAVAIVAVGSTLGNIIPPSILMIIYGTYGNVSVGMLFLGGVIPGVLIGLALMAFVSFLAYRYDFGKNDFVGERPKVLSAVARGWAPAGVPAIIIGGVVVGLFTATESAAIAIVYVLFLATFMSRNLTLTKAYSLLLETGKFTGIVMIMASAGSVFGWLLSIYDFPAQCVELFKYMGAGRYTVLFSIFGFFFVLGTFAEPLPLLIMFMPIVRALGDQAGVHPVQMGIMIIMTCSLGLATPPHAICQLIAARIANVHPRKTMGMVSLFCLVPVVIIALTILVPDISLLLPRLLMGKYFYGPQ